MRTVILEAKISELLDLISKDPEALKSENQDLATQIHELSSDILRSSESSRWMVNTAFENLLSDNERLVWQLRIQQRVIRRKLICRERKLKVYIHRNFRIFMIDAVESTAVLKHEDKVRLEVPDALIRGKTILFNSPQVHGTFDFLQILRPQIWK